MKQWSRIDPHRLFLSCVSLRPTENVGYFHETVGTTIHVRCMSLLCSRQLISNAYVNDLPSQRYPSLDTPNTLLCQCPQYKSDYTNSQLIRPGRRVHSERTADLSTSDASNEKQKFKNLISFHNEQNPSIKSQKDPSIPLIQTSKAPSDPIPILKASNIPAMQLPMPHKSPSHKNGTPRKLTKRPNGALSPLRNFKFEYSIFDKNADLFDHVEWKRETAPKRDTSRKKQNFDRNPQKPMKMKEQKKVEILSQVTVKDLAFRMSVKSRHVLCKLAELGEKKMNDSSVLSQDIAELVVEASDMTPILLPPEFVDAELTVLPSDCSEFAKRPPVICVMGHVDHGKTTLLDALRKSNVAAGEHGGITQSIGAFSVDIGEELDEQGTITFLDTPGHAIFSSMRSRGTEITDIIILVIAADDGLQQQAIEAIQLAQKNNVPLIVAVTKCDVHHEDPKQVHQRIGSQLLRYGVVIESMGGETPIVSVSGKTKEGLADLQETILLHAEIMDLRANTNTNGEAVVLEACNARGIGSQADVIVKWGTLRLGQHFVCGLEHGKIKCMFDAKGNRLKEVTPGHPTRIVGLKNLPNAGDALLVVENEETAKKIVSHRNNRIEWNILASAAQNGEPKAPSLGFHRRRKWEEIEMRRRLAADEAKRISALQPGDDGFVPHPIPIIIKTDSVGVIGAIDQLLATLPNTEFAITQVASEVGPITSSDIASAHATGAVIFAFNVKHGASIEKEALEKNVNIRPHRIVYSLMEDVRAMLQERMGKVEKKTVFGSAEIMQLIPISGPGRRQVKVAGCRVTKGKLTKDAKVQVIRNGIVIVDDVSISSLRLFKESVGQVTKGQECGLQFLNTEEFEKGDILEAYTVHLEAKMLE